MHFLAQGRIRTEQQLLTGLSLCIERTTNLHSAERTVRKHTSVFTSERHPLRYTLVDNRCTDLCQTINVSLTSTVIASFNRIIKQSIDCITVVLIVLCCIDTTLCSNRMGTTRRVLNAEIKHAESHFTKRSSSRCTRQTCSYDDDIKFALVRGINKLLMSFIVCPLL